MISLLKPCPDHASAGQSDWNVNYSNDKVLFWSVADGFNLGLFCFSYLTSSHWVACIFLHPLSQKHFHFCSCDIVISITSPRFPASEVKQQTLCCIYCRQREILIVLCVACLSLVCHAMEVKFQRDCWVTWPVFGRAQVASYDPADPASRPLKILGLRIH